ncbi:MAG: ISAzo13 family transposase [Thermaerobacter sp.]|nr:ISAzo13 family transposase [Thermaerobacter sp.]
MRIGQEISQFLREQYAAIAPVLNEKARRFWAGAAAAGLGHGGIAAVSQMTGLAPNTVRAGVRDVQDPEVVASPRIRRPGAGRKRVSEADPTLVPALLALVAPATRGDPERPLLWVSKSLPNLTTELHRQGHTVSAATVSKLLHAHGYSLQSLRKVHEGKKEHPDRDAQFQFIAQQRASFQAAGEPMISVDTKNKILVGNFFNKGQDWQVSKHPIGVNAYDFLRLADGKAAPYGVYDVGANEAFVNVGQSHDTPEFAVASIRGWWDTMGRERYPNATRLFITSDSGGSNSAVSRVYKVELQALANATGLEIYVSHYPPGTSKWNPIEHKTFSPISINWRGKPLFSFHAIVHYISHTTNATGLKIKAVLDERTYKIGRKVSKAALAQVNIERNAFQGKWNYIIRPTPPVAAGA